MRLVLILCFMCTAFAPMVNAQEYTPEQQEIIDFIEDLEYAVDHFTGSSDISKFLSFYSENFRSEIMEYSIDGTGRFIDYNYPQFKQNMMRAAENEDEEITYNITDINYVQVIGFGAVINFNAEFAINEDGEKLFSGSRNTTMQLKRTPEGWKIINSYTSEVRDDIIKYLCTYNLFQKTDNEVVAKVKYPAGTYFQQAYVDLTFEKKNGDTISITTDKGDLFLWENNILSAPESTGRSKRVGVAADRSQAISEIIQYYYRDVCSSVRVEL